MNLEKQGRVLYVSMVDITEPTGPGVNEREFLLSLNAALGDRMHALLPCPGRKCEEIDRRRITFYHKPHRWNPIGFLIQQFEMRRRLRQLLHGGSFDLMVIRLSILPLALYIARKTSTPFAVKTLGEVQGLTRNTGLKGLVSKLIAPLNWLLVRGIIQHATAVDACTEILLQHHRRHFGLAAESITLVNNATNVRRFTPQLAEAAKKALAVDRFDQILGYVGGAPADRGGMQILELLRRLKHDFPRLGALIVGDDRDGTLRRRTVDLNLTDRVVLPGITAYEKIPQYVNCFDIGFALDRPERMRSTGNSYQKVRQYLACGKSVISCIDECSELVRCQVVENVDPDDLDGLERAVRKILGNDRRSTDRRATQATKLARERLSTDVAMRQRLSFWSNRLDRRCA